jgi:Lon protease-like protein
MDLPLPMFPLGMVVFPYTAVPLRVFEPRYQSLLDRVLASDRRFGIVLIERGFEVGGGDERFSTGTLAEVVEVGDLEGGHRAAIVAGIERIEVVRWLDDNPHPWAIVVPVAEAAEPPPRIDVASNRLERVLALASELGTDVAAFDRSLADDPVAASYQLAALAPVPTIDHQRLLECPGAHSRVEAAITLLEEQAELLVARLAEG